LKEEKDIKSCGLSAESKKASSEENSKSETKRAQELIIIEDEKEISF